MLLMVGILSAGCGGSRDGIVQIQGEVTYDGQPVPTGRIDFIPVGNEGATGSGGYAMIKAGAFDTRTDGKGLAPGNYLARLNGFDGVAGSDGESSYGKLLFERYEQEIEITPGQEAIRFDVPN